MTARADLVAAWRAFHRANPRVYELFEQYTFEAARRRAHYSAKAIFERIRWHTEIETTGADFKLNNNFHAYYARLFMKRHPRHDGFFRTRDVTRVDQVAA